MKLFCRSSDHFDDSRWAVRSAEQALVDAVLLEFGLMSPKVERLALRVLHERRRATKPPFWKYWLAFIFSPSVRAIVRGRRELSRSVRKMRARMSPRLAMPGSVRLPAPAPYESKFTKERREMFRKAGLLT